MRILRFIVVHTNDTFSVSLLILFIIFLFHDDYSTEWQVIAVLKEGVRRFVIKFWALWESMIHQEIGRPETDTSQWKKNLSAQPRSGRCRGACEERPSQAIDASLSRRSFFVRRGATCYSSHFPSLLVEVRPPSPSRFILPRLALAISITY